MAARRLVRVTGLVVAGLAAVALLLTAGLLVLLQTRTGSDLLLGQALPRVDSAIAGKLDVARVRLSLRRLVLEGLVLRGLDGELVAEVERIEVGFSPLDLVRGRLDLRSVDVQQPRVWLRSDQRGLNLVRTLADPDAQDSGGSAASDLKILVQRLTLTGGRVELRVVQQQGERRWSWRYLSATGRGAYHVGMDAAEAELTLAGQQVAPYPASLDLVLTGQLRRAAGQARVKLLLGDSRLIADIRSPDRGGQRQRIALEQLRLDPALLRVLLPRLPVISPISARGKLRRTGDRLETDLGVKLAGGRVTIDGPLDLERLHSPGLRLRGEGLDLAVLLAGAPVSKLGFALQARGGGRSLDTLQGEISLELSRGTLAGRPLGPARLQLRADHGRFELGELSADLPGTRLTARGRATRRRLALTATVRTTSLAETIDSLVPGEGRALVTGRGHLRAEVEGPWGGPALRARGRFSRMGLRGHQARELSLRVRVPNLRRPWRASGSILAGSARLAERQLGRVGMAVRTADGRSFSAQLSLAQPQPLTISARGRWSEDRDALDLRRLQISYAATIWRLLVPSRITFGEAVAVDELRLGAGPQRLSLAFRQSSEHLDATITLRNLALGRLPAIARPPGLMLAGRLDASLRAQGPPAAPMVTARGTLVSGQIGRVRDLTVGVAARLEDARMRGEVNGQARAGQVRAQFDLPTVFPPPAPAPVALVIQAPGLDLASLLAMAGLPHIDLAGRARLALQLTGTGAAPKLDARAGVDRLTAGGRAIGHATLTIASGPAQDLTGDLEMTTLGRPGRARVRIPVTLGQLLRDPPSAAGLLGLGFRATATLDQVPLASLGRLAAWERRLGGTASLALDVRGPARQPTGSLHVSLTGASAPGLPPTDARLEVQARDSAQGLTGQLTVTRGDRTLAIARGSLGLPSSRFGDRRALSRAPLQLEAGLGPIRLQRLVAPADSDRGPPRFLRGQLTGQVRLEGSLGQPRLVAQADIQDATLAGAALGDAWLKVLYDDQRPQVELRLDGSDGGYVRLRAESEVNLGYQLVASGDLDLWRMPISARLEAHRYDLTPLSCLSDAVRVVEGRLAAQAELEGSLSSPRLQGRLEWKDGRLLVAGAGDYRQIHLLAHGDDSRMVLDELTASSAGGSARLTATAERGPGPGLDLEARADLRRFPIHADGQRLASISAAPVISGRLSANRAELQARIDEAHVQLARGQRRDLQSLRRPPGVVLYWGDQPLNRAQADKHQALVEARRALLADPHLPVAPTEGDDGAAPAASSPPLVRLQVQAPNNLWVRGPDVNVELGLGPDFVVLARPEPAVFGTVFIRRGQVEVIGRRFRLDRSSTVRFNGPPAEPVLQIRAVHTPRHADMTVAVNIGGSAENIDLKVSSPEHPEYAQADLLAVVATGRPPDEGGDVSATPGAQAASLLGGFLADRLQRTLTRRLPIDVLNIDPGDGLRGTQLEAGTYLGDDLYVAYVGRFGGEDPFLRENQNELQLEYRLSQRWSFEAVYGDARRGSADIVWTRRY